MRATALSVSHCLGSRTSTEVINEASKTTYMEPVTCYMSESNFSPCDWKYLCHSEAMCFPIELQYFATRGNEVQAHDFLCPQEVKPTSLAVW